MFTNDNYDYFILLRFDIFFIKDFSKIDFDKLNIISILEKDDVSDDNFYMFPLKYYQKFYEIMKKYKFSPRPEHMYLHFCKNIFEETFEVNYLIDERVRVDALSFFKIHYL